MRKHRLLNDTSRFLGHCQLMHSLHTFRLSDSQASQILRRPFTDYRQNPWDISQLGIHRIRSFVVYKHAGYGATVEIRVSSARTPTTCYFFLEDSSSTCFLRPRTALLAPPFVCNISRAPPPLTETRARDRRGRVLAHIIDDTRARGA